MKPAAVACVFAIASIAHAEVPDAARETRPLWERPRPEPLHQQIERDANRGAGRIEDDSTWQLRQLQRDRDERSGLLDRQREFERFQQDHDRQLQVEQLQHDERIAAEAQRKQAEYEGAQQRDLRDRSERAVGSALADWSAIDRRAMERIEERHRRKLRTAEQWRDRELKGIDSNRKRSDAQREQLKADALKRFEERRAELERQRESRRATILGR